LAEVKKAAQAKTMKDVHETFAKQAKAKDKAIKEAVFKLKQAIGVNGKSS